MSMFPVKCTLKRPQMYVSMSPCLHVSMSPCLHVSMSPRLPRPRRRPRPRSSAKSLSSPLHSTLRCLEKLRQALPSRPLAAEQALQAPKTLPPPPHGNSICNPDRLRGIKIRTTLATLAFMVSGSYPPKQLGARCVIWHRWLRLQFRPLARASSAWASITASATHPLPHKFKWALAHTHHHSSWALSLPVAELQNRRLLPECETARRQVGGCIEARPWPSLALVLPHEEIICPLRNRAPLPGIFSEYSDTQIGLYPVTLLAWIRAGNLLSSHCSASNSYQLK
jgi:hypothetical protein